MSQIKISQLPSWTGTPADLRWFVMNDQGENTTYKFSGYTAGLINGTGSNSLRSADITTTAAIASGTDSMAVGNGAQATGTYSMAIGYNTTQTSGNGGVAIGWASDAGDSSVSIGGSHVNSGTASVALGYDNTTTSNYNIAIGASQVIGTSAPYSISIGNGGGQIQNNAQESIAIGRVGNVNQPYQYAFGVNNGVGNGQRVMNLSYDNNSFLNGNWSVGIGQNFNQGGNYHVLIGKGNGNQGGTDMIHIGRDVQSSTNTSNIIGIGETQTINSAGSVVIGHDSSITSSGSENNIFGGTRNVISGTSSNVVLLGLNDFTSPTISNTTYIDNNHILKTESFDVVAGGNVSGNVTVDCTLGSIFTMTLVGNVTQIDFVGLRSGQRLEFIIENTTYNVSGGALINGVSGYVYSKNGTITPSNNSITHYTATYDGTRLFLDEEGQFQVV